MTQQDVLASLLEECRDDHVGLWELLNAAHIDLGTVDPEEARRVALALVRRLINEPGIVVGHPAPDGRQFVSWNLTPEDAYKRIERELSALGRDPRIGEVAWFTSAD
jgi:hypothetical protein